MPGHVAYILSIEFKSRCIYIGPWEPLRELTFPKKGEANLRFIESAEDLDYRNKKINI